MITKPNLNPVSTKLKVTELLLAISRGLHESAYVIAAHDPDEKRLVLLTGKSLTGLIPASRLAVSLAIDLTSLMPGRNIIDKLPAPTDEDDPVEISLYVWHEHSDVIPLVEAALKKSLYPAQLWGCSEHPDAIELKPCTQLLNLVDLNYVGAIRSSEAVPGSVLLSKLLSEDVAKIQDADDLKQYGAITVAFLKLAKLAQQLDLVTVEDWAETKGHGWSIDR